MVPGSSPGGPTRNKNTNLGVGIFLSIVLSMKIVIKEFELAESLIESMAMANNLEDYEQHWRDFLRNLDRGFNKLSDICSSFKIAKSTVDSIVVIRKNDPLIQYLMQARNCDEHTVRSITTRTQGFTRIQGGENGGTIIKGEIVGGEYPGSLEISGNLNIEFKIDYLRVIPVLNRNIKYEVPTTHLGKKITSEMPHVLAKLGLDFYKTKLVVLEAIINR